MTKDEALKLALEALKYSDTVFYPRTSIAIAAIERALAQPEQEPDYENTLHWHALNYRTAATENAQEMFEALESFVCTTPPQRTWVGLTYEDMTKLQKDLYDAKGESVLPTTFAMAVEAKLKEKNNG